VYLRNYRIFIVYGKPAKRFTQQIMDDLVQVRNTIRVSLSAARIDSMNTDVNAFLSAMREMLNYRQDQVMTSSGEYNEDEKLNRQVVDPSIDVRVRPSHIRLELPESMDAGGARLPASACRVINMQLNKNPRRFALWQGADNLQNLRFPDLGIPCPFMLTWTTELEEQTATQNEALRKDMDLSKKAASAYGQLFPGTKRAADEWRRNREQLSSNEIAFCRTYLNLTLFTPDNNTDAQACELAAVNVFRKNDLEMVTVQYQQMRNWLACFPFMMQEGMWEDMKMTGATLRCKSWNAVNLMPVVAERQLSHVGMPLPTYRNQVAFFDMFGEENGSTNFNIAVTGTSGAGKSFLTQGILRDVLNAGGFAWVIDMGDSYKNYCQQAGGVYLDGAKLRFNPFANVKDIKHSAEGIVRLLTVLASPTEPLDGVCEAILQKAVMDAWDKKQQGARIDDVHNYLTHPDVNGAFSDKPTIISRLAELAMLLETYCTWGPDGEYFNADNPTLDGETRFAVLELLSLEDKPKLLSSILFSLILAIQEKMYHSPRDLKKVCIIDEAWRLLGGSNPHAARFIETGYRTVRRHRGSFITITQGIKDFSASKEAEAAWNNSSTKITLLQDARAFKQYLSDNPDQFSDMEKEVIRGFQPALQTGYSSLLISAGEFSSFHRLFVDPITRAMFSSRGEDFAYMQNAQKAGATSEEAAYLLAEKKFGDELRELEEWVKAA